MNKLSRIFQQTIAPSADYGSKDEAKEQGDVSDPMLDAFVPQGDRVELSSLPNRSGNSSFFAQMNNQSFGGLPSLSRTYSSSTGSLLDIKG
jgi:hypothetical protein